MSFDRSSRSRKIAIGLGLLVVVGGAGFFVWKSKGKHPPAESASPAKSHKDTYYCPMHPSYKSDKPDNCPVCSMKLVKMEPAPTVEGRPGHQHGMGGMGSTSTASSGTTFPAGKGIFVPPQRQQMIGMQTVLVKEMALT